MPLNLQIRKNTFPMPLIDEIFNQLGQSKCSFAFDLQSGFYQIWMVLGIIKNSCHNKIWVFLLDNNVVWFENCHKYFHKDDARNVSRMDATILEGVYGCIECA